MVDRAAELHPDAREILERAAGPPTHALSVDGARRAFRDLFELDPLDDDLLVSDRSIPGPEGPETALAVRTYRPPGDGHPVLVYLHGGGWVRGDLDTHDYLCRQLASEAA
jgi:acetyl esterase